MFAHNHKIAKPISKDFQEKINVQMYQSYILTNEYNLLKKGITKKDLQLWSSMTTVNQFLFTTTLFRDSLYIDCFAAFAQMRCKLSGKYFTKDI